MSKGTVRLHRVLAAPVEKVFKALTDAPAMASWLPPYGFTCTIDEFDPKVGGKYHMAFTNFGTGSSHSFGGEYLEIVTNEKLVYTDMFDNPAMPDVMTTTVILKPVLCGTEINITQEGLPEMIPTEMCYLGWQESLDKLKRLVEPNMPDA